MTRLIDAWALMEYCNNQKGKTIDANDIARFPTAYGWTSVMDKLPSEHDSLFANNNIINNYKYAEENKMETVVHCNKKENAELIAKILDADVNDEAYENYAEWIEWWPGDCALIMTGEEMLFSCSNCGAKYINKHKFCANCGKRMKNAYQEETISD